MPPPFFETELPEMVQPMIVLTPAPFILKAPPPEPPAVLPERVLFVMVMVAPRLRIAPPEEVVDVLPVKVQLAMVRVPPF